MGKEGAIREEEEAVSVEGLKYALHNIDLDELTNGVQPTIVAERPSGPMPEAKVNRLLSSIISSYGYILS